MIEINGEKFVFYGGKRFCRDDQTGYYRSNIGELLHRYVWEQEVGKIPDGYQVHHKDQDKSNNSIENLELMLVGEHQKLHGKLLTDEQREWRRNNIIENAVPKATEWHRSEEGHEWHKQQYEKMKDVLHAEHEIECKQCHKKVVRPAGSEFCSNACKAKWRRDQGLDDVELTCSICGKKFKKNRYAMKNRTEFACSRQCGAFLIARHKRLNKLKKGEVITKDQRKPAPDWVILPRDSEGRV